MQDYNEENIFNIPLVYHWLAHIFCLVFLHSGREKKCKIKISQIIQFGKKEKKKKRIEIQFHFP